MKKLLTFVLVVLFSSPLFAQRVRVFEQYSFGYAFAKKISVPTFMYSQRLVFGKNQMFAVGSGLRMTYFSEKDKPFVGVEKQFSTTSIRVFPRASMTAFNIPLIAEYNGKKIIAGFNIDLIGLTFGKKRDSLSVKGFIGRTDSLSVKPTTLNFLMGSQGTTNNEVYVGFKLQEEIIIRAGLSFLFTRYDARYANRPKLGSFRYNTTAMPFISIVFNIEK